MKKLFLMLITATMVTGVANATTSSNANVKKVADKENQMEILASYAENFEEVTYIDNFKQLAMLNRTAGIDEGFKYVRLYKSNDAGSDGLLALGVTESGLVLEFEMGGVCDWEESACQCEDPGVEETYGTPVYVDGDCICIGSCNPNNPN